MPRLVLAALAALAALVAQASPALAFRNFSVPSDSMLPTLGAGDVVTAALYELDYSGLAAGKALAPSEDPAFQPQRGDVAFFTADGGTVFVMRIVGLPGDVVEMRGGRLVLDGAPVASEPVGAVEGACPEAAGECRFLRETLPGGRSYVVLDTAEASPGDDTAPVTVPEGCYFMLGDNRDNAADSRFGGTEFGLIGTIPRDDLVGRLHAILYSPRPAPPTAERVEGFPELR